VRSASSRGTRRRTASRAARFRGPAPAGPGNQRLGRQQDLEASTCRASPAARRPSAPSRRHRVVGPPADRGSAPTPPASPAWPASGARRPAPRHVLGDHVARVHAAARREERRQRLVRQRVHEPVDPPLADAASLYEPSVSVSSARPSTSAVKVSPLSTTPSAGNTSGLSRPRRARARSPSARG